MEIIRHPGYMEFQMPEFFDLDPRMDNLSRIFSAVQPGAHNLLLDLTGYHDKPPARDEVEVLHFTRALGEAFMSITDEVDLIAILVDPEMLEEAKAYAKTLESVGFEVRLFTDRPGAAGWLGNV